MDKSRKYITLIEIGKKQTYIFSSNRLAENVGASIIIRKATEDDPEEFYRQYSPDVIYEGGGNALYVFRSKADGIEFAKAYSRYVMEEYPGLVLYLVGCELTDDMTVKEGTAECHRLLEQKKNEAQHMVHMIDFGSTRRCSETNLPSVPCDERILPDDRRGKPISAESVRKYKYSFEHKSYFKELLPEDYDFPSKLGELGQTEDESSYIAVVHIDGNRMSSKIASFNNKMKRQEGETGEEFDARYIQGLRELSSEIDQKYKEAFRELIGMIIKNMDKLKETLDLSGNCLPIRPLIMAGDDICFVTEGRIGVECARIFLENIQKKQVQGIPLNACGGAAIVKTHFPFSRAYDLAEALCRNAKNSISAEEDASYLDWHIEQGELKDNLQKIRSQYRAADGAILTYKPYRIIDIMEKDSFLHFKDAFHILLNSEIPRSKILGMREAAYRGKTATEYYLKSNQIDDELERTNWKRGESGFEEVNGKMKYLFFDAMEMLDMYVELE